MQFNLTTTIWLALWYVLVAGFIGFFLFFFRLLNLPQWRRDGGDISTEVGYFEDSVGHQLLGPLNDDSRPDDGDAPTPHVQASSNPSQGNF